MKKTINHTDPAADMHTTKGLGGETRNPSAC